MTPGVGVEGKIREGRIPGVDTNRLGAQQEKDWPQEVQAKGRCDGRTKGDARLRSLGPQRYGEMSDEHRMSPQGSRIAACRVQERDARDPSMRMSGEEFVGRHIHCSLSTTRQPHADRAPYREGKGV